MAEYGPQDWGGAGLSLSDGDVIYGEHTNIGDLLIPLGATVHVKRYDGTADTGEVTLRCYTASIHGVLTAAGKGFGGGGGGGAGGGGAAIKQGGYPVAGGGQVGQTCPAGAGANGSGGSAGGTFSHPFVGGSAPGGAGGAGGAGNGTYPGVAGLLNGGIGGDAGYMSAGGNGDATTDASVIKGSGGGGGGGGAGGAGWANSASGMCCGGGGGGGGGGMGQWGGGCIRIIATRILLTGTIIATNAGDFSGSNGTGAWYNIAGTDYVVGGTGGAGGNVDNQLGAGGTGGNPTGLDGGGNWGSVGGAGGKGAGGGILLQFSYRLAQATASNRFKILGTVNNTGGLGATNGGSLKIFSPVKDVSGSIQSGRDYRPTVRPFGIICT